MNNSQRLRRRDGFTLVELSIVIIIIGFLITGIAAGQSLIKQAALNSVINDLTNYSIALREFKARYSYLPGDLPKADSYWSTAISGDGDGIVNFRTESFNSWQHLSLANLIVGQYPGGNDGTLLVAGVNVPASKFSSGALFAMDYNIIFGHRLNRLTFGKVETTLNAPATSVMSVIDASAIDTKLDDGDPGSGKMLVIMGYEHNSSTSFCTDGNPDATPPIHFVFSDTSVSCRLFYAFDWE